MKKFLTLVVALVMVIPVMAKGRNDGSSQANAIDFVWGTPMTHSGGTKWYVVNLDPLRDFKSPALTLSLTNKSATSAVHTRLQASLAGKSVDKSYTIAPKQQRNWTESATALVHMSEVYLTLTSDGAVEISARAFENAELDETCKDALPFDWANGLTKPAGDGVWYKVDIQAAKANTAKDVRIILTNNGGSKLNLNADISLECPAGGPIKRSVSVAAGKTVCDTIPNSMLRMIAYDEVYVKLKNDQPFTIKVEYADRPTGTPVMPADDPAGSVQYDLQTIPAPTLETSETIILHAGVTYYLKYSVADLNAYPSYEPEFTFHNPGAGSASVDRQMAFEVPAYVARVSTLELGADDEAVEVISKSTLLGLDAEYIYVKITPTSDIELTTRFKHEREGKACKTNIDFDWDNGHRQAANTMQWYAVDLSNAKAGMKDIIVHVQNRNATASANLKGSVAFSCPSYDVQEISRSVGAGKTVEHRFNYSFYAMMSDMVWIGVETNQEIKFWAELVNAEKQAVVDSLCLEAVDFNWKDGVHQKANTTVWYRVDMTQVRDLAAKFPTIFVQNLSNSAAAVITGELSLECPDSLANTVRTKTIAAGESYSKPLSRDLFEHITSNEVFVKVHTTQEISLQIRLNEESEGTSCASAVPFNWVSGNSQAANTNVWYSVDLREVMKAGNDIIVHIENKANATCKGVAQLIYECPCEYAPSVRTFTLNPFQEKHITLQNSAFDVLTDSMAYINIEATTGLRAWAEILPVESFDPILADGINLIPLEWDVLYTQSVDTAWYILPQSEIEKVRNRKDKVKPVAHLYNLGSSRNVIKGEAAFAFPITKKMMTKSQALSGNQHFTDTVPAGTFEQVLKKDSIIFRVTRPAGSADFQFRAELIKAFTGESRTDALPFNFDEQYTQSPNSDIWYKINTKELKKDKNLFNKSLRIFGKNAGKGDARVNVAVYEGLISSVDKFEEFGVERYREQTIKKGKSKTQDIPAQAIYGVGDTELYIRVRTTDSLVFSTKFNGVYAPQAVDPAQAKAKMLVPNVEYVIPGDNQEHWYLVCLPYIKNNYIYSADSKLEYEFEGPATVEGTFTFQDEMDCKMPVRSHTFDKSHKGYKLLSELFNRAFKRATNRNFDISDFRPELIDSLLHRYVTNDSLTGYVRIKTDKDLKVKLVTPQITGDACTNGMPFDWEHGNVNPAGADSWYLVRLDPEIIPDTCDLRLHVDNWSAEANDVRADLYFDCADPATKSKSYTLEGNGKDSIDIDRDLLEQLGWADMIINYYSDKVSHIWAELIPDVPRDTLRDTIVAYVCEGGMFEDTITGIVYDPVESYMEWSDTVSFQDGLVMKDSITLFQVYPLVMPKVEGLTVDSMKQIGAAPLLVQGMQLFVDSSNVKLTELFRNLANSEDTITGIDTVYWAKPVYKASGELNDKAQAPLDLAKFYQKTDIMDTLLLVIESDTCGFVSRTEYVFPLDLYKYVSKKDTICPPAPAKNPDSITVKIPVLDTLNLPRYIDTIVSYSVRIAPELYTQKTTALLPVVNKGAAIDTLNTLASLKNQFAAAAGDLTMAVNDIKWQVLVGADWQDLPYTVPVDAATITMRYVVTTECDDVLNSENFVFNVGCVPTASAEIKLDGCDSYHWATAELDTTFTVSTIYSYVIPNVAGCDSTINLNVAIHNSVRVNAPDVAACGSYQWQDAAAGFDTTIVTSGIYTHKFLTYPYGCDSVVTLNVTINAPLDTIWTEAGTLDETTYYWDVNDSTYSDTPVYNGVSGLDVYIKPGQNNECDTIYGLHLFITHKGEGECQKDTTRILGSGCHEYHWKTADIDTLIHDNGTYTHVFQNILDCDSVVILTVALDMPYIDTLQAVGFYGDRLISINLHQINALPGWHLDDMDNGQGYVKWYKMAGAAPDPSSDQLVATGYYYTLDKDNLPDGKVGGDPIPAGTYYATVEIPDASGCGASGITVPYTISAAAAAPALMPSLARPGEDIKVVNLNPMAETTIRIYSTEGLLQKVYTTSGEETFIIQAAEHNGIYLVELLSDDLKSTLRYIVK